MERSKQKRAPVVSYFSAEREFSNRTGISGTQSTVNPSQSGLIGNVSLSLEQIPLSYLQVWFDSV